MSVEHYALANQLARQIRSGEIRQRFKEGTVGSWELAHDVGCSSTTALWALRLLAQGGLVQKIGETSYGSEIYRIFYPGTAVKVPAVRASLKARPYRHARYLLN